MARGGINKALVKLALERLAAKGEHPSIDAVRIELGNTGSKTTISRYLAELNDGSSSRFGDKTSLSDTLSELVGNLAAQLHREAEEIVEQAKAANLTAMGTLQARVAAGDQAQAEAKRHIALLESQLSASEQSRQTTTHQSHEQLLKIERLTQALHDKDAQLAVKDNHITSLEEKHQHARQALEHYRDSVKEQREQDQRRHETQVQQLQAEIRQLNQTISIKQTDITQLNKDNSRLATEISEVRKQLRASEHGHQLLSAQQKTHEDAIATLTAQLAEAARIQRGDTEEMSSLKQQLVALQNSTQSMQVELITAKTELTVKNQLFESLNHNFRPQ